MLSRWKCSWKLRLILLGAAFYGIIFVFIRVIASSHYITEKVMMGAFEKEIINAPRMQKIAATLQKNSNEVDKTTPAFLKTNMTDIANTSVFTLTTEAVRGSAHEHSASLDIPAKNCSAYTCRQGICFENLLCLKLPPFLPDYKNPCFEEKVVKDNKDQSIYENLISRVMVSNFSIAPAQNYHRLWRERRELSDTQIRCLPYFFIIGMEKCGTTDIYNRLSMHPDISLSSPKELQWWTRRRFFYSVNGTFPPRLQADEYKLTHKHNLVGVPFSHYYAFFDVAADKIMTRPIRTNGSYYFPIITGDGSPNIMYWNDFAEIFDQVTNSGPKQIVAHHIAAVLPKARIIITLRNPIDRLYSSYLFFNRGVTPETFHKVIEEGIRKFEECEAEHSLRYCVYDWQLKQDVGSTVNLMQGIYSVMLKDWLRVFPKTQLHVVHFESYMANELKEMNGIFQFLDVPLVTEGTRLASKIKSSPTSLAGKQYAEVGEMHAKTRSILHNFYAPFNQALAKLVQDDRFDWKL